MRTTFRIELGDGAYFVARRRFIIGCTVTDDIVTVYMVNIKEPLVIGDKRTAMEFLRFLEGQLPDERREKPRAESSVSIEVGGAEAPP